MKSEELQPGDRFVIDPNNPVRIYTIDRRKDPSEPGHNHSGWWLSGGGGFADFVLDGYIAERRFHPVEEDPAYARLNRWKAEALIVMDQWELVWKMVKHGPIGTCQWDDVAREILRLNYELAQAKGLEV